jgi:lipopolysaccharide export system protein LptA
VKVTADQFVVDEKRSDATFSGNVVVTHGTLTMWAGQVVIRYGAKGQSDIESLTATGGVRVDTGAEQATGREARFDPSSQTIRLSGDVKVSGQGGSMTGPELTIDLRTNTTTFRGSGGGGRVTGVFTPQ